MTAVTFGDLLFTGAGHLEVAVARWDRETADPLMAAMQLRRVIDVMTRYADDVVSPDLAADDDPADLAWWPRAGAEIEQALQRASYALGRAAGILGGQDGAELPPDLPLADAATALLAARDLLSTHLASDQASAPVATEWTAVIGSPPVTRAVTDLVAWWCEQLVPLADYLAALRPGDRRRRADLDIAESGQWLSRAAAAAGPARVADPVSAQDRTLLFAIPSASESRERPRPGETPTELCRGITLSAGRLQAAARAASGYAATSAVATAGAWRWTATAGAVTGHLSAAMLRSLAARAGPLGLPASDLDAAAAAVTTAQEAWQRLAAAWGLLTTETRFLATAAVTEASDLVIRFGRLACDNPQWTPEAAQRAPFREPAVLAPDAATAAVIIAAVHHGACAFERVAAADMAAAGLARRAGRLYVPVRVLSPVHGRTDRLTIPRVYVMAAEDKTGPLLDAYQADTAADWLAAQALDEVALAAAAPSRAMAQARQASRHQAAAGPRDLPGPQNLEMAGRRPGRRGPVEDRLLQLGVTDPLMLQRAVILDAAARNLIGEAETAAAAAGPASAAGRDAGARRARQAPARRARRPPGPAR